jgi:hypothetical protein
MRAPAGPLCPRGSNQINQQARFRPERGFIATDSKSPIDVKRWRRARSKLCAHTSDTEGWLARSTVWLASAR